MSDAPIPALPVADLAHALDLVETAAWERLRGQRLLLTGGTGFVGKWLLATLAAADQRFELGVETTVLSRNPAAFAAQAPQLVAMRGMTLVQGDVRNFEPPRGRFDSVIHAATDVIATAQPQDTFDTCVDGTRRALAVAQHCGATDFLLVSSGAVYGTQPPSLEALPETFTGTADSLSPASAYGLGKRAAEWLVTAHAAEHGLRATIARCFAFVGPYLPLDKHFAIGNFIGDALAGRPIVVRGDGTPWRSYLYAADMAGWLWATLLVGTSGRAYNVGGTEAVSIAELARRVSALLGSTAPITIEREATPAVPAARYVPDVAKARDELRLPPPVGLDESILRTARWHRELIRAGQ